MSLFRNNLRELVSLNIKTEKQYVYSLLSESGL